MSGQQTGEMIKNKLNEAFLVLFTLLTRCHGFTAD